LADSLEWIGCGCGGQSQKENAGKVHVLCKGGDGREIARVWCDGLIDS